MRKRFVQVRLVKDDVSTLPPPPGSQDRFITRAAISSELVKDVVWHGAKIVCLFITADTMRKVAIELAKK